MVAIKKLRIETLTQEALTEFTQEAQLMSQLRHPNIVAFYSICTEPNHYCIVMEYCDKGSLYSWLRTAEATSWTERLRISRELAKGLLFLHGKGIIHRDLKSPNVLLDRTLTAKISDFGLSKVKTETSSHTTGGMKGTLRWNPPELVKGEVKHHSDKTDMYSFGMTLWEIASRQLPYASQDNEVMVGMWIMQGIKETVPAGTPPSLAQLIGLCWEERSRRPTAQTAVEMLESEESVAASFSPISGYRLTSDMPARPPAPVVNYGAINYPLQPYPSTPSAGYRLASDVPLKPTPALAPNFSHHINPFVPQVTAPVQAPLANTSYLSQPALPSAPASSFFAEIPQTAHDKVTAMAASVKAVVDPRDVTALLKWVAEGHLEEVEKLLQKNPKLALVQGEVSDLTRAFPNLTAFQYAVWVLDHEMWEIILKYLDKAQAALQLDALENHRTDITEKYGAHFNFDPLLNEYKVYLDKYNSWHYEQCEGYWCKKVGGEQRKVPAWYIYALSEKGYIHFSEKTENPAWSTKDITKRVEREYRNDHVKCWLVQGSSVLGISFGWVRHYDGWREPCGAATWDMVPSWQKWERGIECVHHDHEVTQLLKSRQMERLGKLQASLNGSSSVDKPLLRRG